MELNEIRNEIDKIDDSLAALFKDRMALAARVADYKAKNGIPVRNPQREREIISRLTKHADPDIAGYTKMLMETIFSLSRSYQTARIKTKGETEQKIETALESTPKLMPQNAVVACQGTEGAYSQKACEKIFSIPEIMYFDSFSGVCSAVQNGLCDYGVLPIENSIQGSVKAVYDLMRMHKFYIVRVQKYEIHHTLLAKPGVLLSDVREVFSHAQALGQCEAYLHAHGIKVHTCSNTAQAAKMVSESTRTDIAAIADRDCASLYGLTILDDNIQKSDNNITRFICISKKPEIYPGASKMSLLVSLPHRPGALYELISKFSALGINLSKIESFPIAGESFTFRFCLDMDISVYSPGLYTLLRELESGMEEFSFLGCYTEG